MNRNYNNDSSNNNNNNNYRKQKPSAPRDDKQHWDVATVQERGESKYWTKIGIAFKNDNGSFRVMLDALPVNGQLYLFPPK